MRLVFLTFLFLSGCIGWTKASIIQPNSNDQQPKPPIPDPSTLFLNETLNQTANFPRNILEENPNLDESDISKSGFTICDPNKKGICRGDLMEVCRQLNGVYRCLCPENFSRTSQGKCNVFNECFEKSANDCAFDAACIDLEEGYTCKCKNGFHDLSPNANVLPGRICMPESSSSISSSSPKPQEISNFAPKNESSSIPEKSFPSIGENRDFENKHQINIEDSQSSNFFHSESKNVNLQTTSETSSSTVENAKQTLQSIDGSQPQPRLTVDDLRDVFSSFDTDRNDLVGYPELKSAVELYRLKLTDGDVEKMIKVADSTGEGMVDFGEFMAIMTR